MHNINKLQEEQSWTEEDVELAERYARALETINEYADSFTEEDVEQAEKYAATLKEIGESEVSV